MHGVIHVAKLRQKLEYRKRLGW